MDILEAIVAFSLLMIVFSTIVSAIVEFINRVGHRREKGFARLVDRMHDEMRQRILPSEGPVSAAGRDAFRHAIVANKAVRELPPIRTYQVFDIKLIDPIGLLVWCSRKFSSWFAPRQVAKMDAVEFARRMAETDIGREIARQGETNSDNLIEEISKRFEEHSAQARDYFRQSAYAASILVSVGFAFFANIDAVRLFETLKDDSRLRSSIASESETIISNFKEQEQIMQKAIEEGKKLDAAEWEKVEKKVQSQLAPFKGTLPIGFNYFPGCLNNSADQKCTGLTGKPANDSLCAIAGDANTDLGSICANLWAAPFASLKWFLSVLTAGLLIGLGGPFWFGVYTNMSRVLGLAKAVRGAFGGKAKEQTETAEKQKEKATGSEAPQDAFKKASRVIRSTRPRPILGPSGEPI